MSGSIKARLMLRLALAVSSVAMLLAQFALRAAAFGVFLSDVARAMSDASVAIEARADYLQRGGR